MNAYQLAKCLSILSADFQCRGPLQMSCRMTKQLNPKKVIVIVVLVNLYSMSRFHASTFKYAIALSIGIKQRPDLLYRAQLSLLVDLMATLKMTGFFSFLFRFMMISF
ncbi:uncharacterized protein BYT42DRAFT_147583 [Radiomyces spectabilis]|uniref:uncharacterized protein n=1 Tax=Radiomyces spectabilis TaxID=64574 RepID=UPI00221FF9CB|nr:uncharacterized protein BYT42DRAFT_147583 [Radiomyces spectabilis]KAI8365950.1 hypothetical protein BYT42DRAFT_147583 [Radiomyces spectabilis]